MPPPAPGVGVDGRAQQQAGGVTWSSLLQYSAPVFPACLLSELLCLGDTAITTFPSSLLQVVKASALKDKTSALHLS